MSRMRKFITERRLNKIKNSKNKHIRRINAQRHAASQRIDEYIDSDTMEAELGAGILVVFGYFVGIGLGILGLVLWGC